MTASPLGPPVLPGYSAAQFRGSGEMVDIYTAEQRSPRRPVLLTVLREPVADGPARERFRAAADLMALVSAHPSVLTVLQASVAVDGRPYIVTELCVRHIAEDGRTLTVDQALELGVRIGSALETEHRAGLLHGGVRPHHLLVTPYGSVVLSATGFAAAFGIESVPSPDEVWTAPEVRAGGPLSVVADVHGLGATLRAMLGEPAPAALRRVLERATSHDPARRQGSALELVLELREAQDELGLPLTPIEVELDGSSVLDARALASAARGRRAGRRGPRLLAWGLLAAAVLAIGLGASAFTALSRAADAGIPTVERLRAEPAEGAVTFTWTDPGLRDGDLYQARRDGAMPELLSAPRHVVAARPGEEVCLSVVVNRDGRLGDRSERICAAPLR